ncbi:hypothetical protein FHW96_001628 [Novosphingobium sp. SG751A]|uniref:head GIN domain-containing protein n=1 Tax=Novosphingobium sp. SG751A TaxID=2587000 RepID=UPI00155580B7|nr:head GIN domain-containing protein [Novosphingobium sp. SG751A]NOW45473.1 hypothetical protein [Novosphingobium sp. SG751A]
MDFRKITSAFAPIIAIGMTTMLSGCHDGEISLHGAGKPLAELDLSGPAPDSLVLLGPDSVKIETGEKLAIKVEGDPEQAAHLRFTLKDGTLGILRDRKGQGQAVSVLVTMPAPKSLTMTGSGRIATADLARKAEINIVGSGDIETPKVEGEKLEVSIGGSGTYRGAGHTADLEVNIAGSGSAEMAALKADKADISILGSGGAQFASDGTVKASMMGSGSVRVKGRAKCEVSAMGSGKLVCEP